MAPYGDMAARPAIHAALDGLHTRVRARPTLARFSKLGVEFALGGPNAYTGRNLPDAHGRTRQRSANDAVFDSS